jgi:hypothetical protein
MVSVYLPPTVHGYQNAEGLMPLYEPKYGLPISTGYAPVHYVGDYWYGDEVPGKNAVAPNTWKLVVRQRRVEGPSVGDFAAGVGRGLAAIPESPPLASDVPRAEVKANGAIVGVHVVNGIAGSGWETTFVLQVNPTTAEYRVIVVARPGYASEPSYLTAYGQLYPIIWLGPTIS